MEGAPTPYSIAQSENENEFNFELKKEVITDKNKKYILLFSTEQSPSLSIKAIGSDIPQKIYSNNFSIDIIKNNKYFYQFDNLKEICEEIRERVEKEKINIIEDTNLVIISIPLPSSKIKEIVFELKENEKSDKEIIKDLINLVNEQRTEIATLKYNLIKFKKEFSFFYKYYIINLDSFIIDSLNDNTILKQWINQNAKIKVNLLYRMTRDGPEILTFHQLCDNKGPTLTLYHLENGNKVGFFVSESFDSTSEWKIDEKCFIFNLNQNIKCQKIKNNSPSFYNNSLCGPSANGLGSNPAIKLNLIYHSAQDIDKLFENGSKILPSKKKETEYRVNEMEIFQIIIG